MFTSSPRFLTLAQQVARVLEEDIRRGALRGILPSERQLVEKLQVSRRTIRAATEMLARKKLIRTAQGVETIILPLSGSRSDRGARHTIGMLLSQPVKLVTVAAAMKPPPAMRKMCRLSMVFLLSVGKEFVWREDDCLETGTIAQLHKFKQQPFTNE